MSSRNYCSRCGGNIFRADRALAGKLICIKCGLPESSINHRYLNRRINSRSNFLVIVLLVIIFMVVLI